MPTAAPRSATTTRLSSAASTGPTTALSSTLPTTSSRANTAAFPPSPPPADIAAAIIAAFDEPDPDRPTYGVFHVVRTVRDGQPPHCQPATARIDATFTDQDSAAYLANALCLTRYRDNATGKDRILSTQQVLECAEDNRPLYLWLRQATRLGTVSEATVVADADLHRLAHNGNGHSAP